MKILNNIILLALISTLSSCMSSSTKAQSGDSTTTLKDVFEHKFLIGTALNLVQIYEKEVEVTRLISSQFNAITAENCMKAMYMQPEEGKFCFDDADKFVEFGEKHGMAIIGHTLIWHSQAPDWFFVDQEGKDVSSEILINRMRSHIHTIVSRYRGRVKGWDVVNEAILDNGDWRESKFYKIIGADFVKLAFQFAHEADPEAELYYNDYSMAIPAKRNGTVRVVENLQEQGVKIDGIGMQGHVGLTYPSISDFEGSILAFSDLGVKVMVTEMDVTVLPSPNDAAGAEVSTNFTYDDRLNPYPTELPLDIGAQWEKRYLDFFSLFLKHSDKIDRVTLWGVGDADSWRNDWPMEGRTDYPLLFDRNYLPKSVVNKINQLVLHKL